MDRKFLTPMTDFVLEQTTNEFSSTRRLSLIIGYAEFIKQPLELGMFVPCKNGIPLQPVAPSFDGSNQQEYDEYREAQEKVLFKGFKFVSYPSMTCVLMYNERIEFKVSFVNNTIERFQKYYHDYYYHQGEIELTETAKIKIYGK